MRIQQRIKNVELGISVDVPEGELPDFPSFIPFLPPLVSIYTSTSSTISHGSYLRSVYMLLILLVEFEVPNQLITNGSLALNRVQLISKSTMLRVSL